MSSSICVDGPPASEVTPEQVAEAIALIGNTYIGTDNYAICGLMWSYAILHGDNQRAIQMANLMAPCDSCKSAAQIQLTSRRDQFHHWAFLCLPATISGMESMQITVISARVVNGHVRAVVRADSPTGAQIHLRVEFPRYGPASAWAAAKEQALRYLDVA